MFKTIKNIVFYSDSAIFFAASFASNLINYVFHFVLVRTVDAAEYGEFQALLALTAVLGIPLAALATAITRYTSVFTARGELGKAAWLFKRATFRMVQTGLVALVVLAIFSGQIGDFLQIGSSWLILVMGAGLLVGALMTVALGVAQGLQKFRALSLVGILSGLLKLGLLFLFLVVVSNVWGPLAAVVISGLVSYLLVVRIVFRSLELKAVNEPSALPLRDMRKYYGPAFLITLFSVVLFNADLILAKHFFTPQMAGEYAALAMVGHLMFFIVSPLITVMFPAAARAEALGSNHLKVVRRTGLMFLAVTVVGAAVYFVIPKLIIRLMLGNNYLELAPLVGYYGLVVALYALVFLAAQYCLSVNKLRFAYVFGAGVALQIIFISAWHKDMLQVILGNGAALLGTFLLLVFYNRTVFKNFFRLSGI